MEAIYRTDGEWVGVYVEGNVFNVDGEWLGFAAGREIFDPAGQYLGFLSDDRRLLRKKSLSRRPPKLQPPPRPVKPRIPASMPLPPMMLAHSHRYSSMGVVGR